MTVEELYEQACLQSGEKLVKILNSSKQNKKLFIILMLCTNSFDIMFFVHTVV